MKSIEEKKFVLEQWKSVLLTIGAISTFLTFFVPFLSQREQQMNLNFSETLKRLGDANPAIRAGAAIDLVHFYEYKRFFGLGSSPYQEQCVFVLQNSLKRENEEDFVRQAIIQALGTIGSNALEGAWLRGADLSNLDIRNVSFKEANLTYANLSRSASQEYQEGDVPVSFERANLFQAEITNAEFWGANFRNTSLERAQLNASLFLRGTDLSNAFFWHADLTNTVFSDMKQGGAKLDGAVFDATNLVGTDFSYTLLKGAIFRNISDWDDKTNFQGANCQSAQFEITSDFYEWGHRRFPDCFK